MQIEAARTDFSRQTLGIMEIHTQRFFHEKRDALLNRQKRLLHMKHVGAGNNNEIGLGVERFSLCCDRWSAHLIDKLLTPICRRIHADQTARTRLKKAAGMTTTNRTKPEYSDLHRINRRPRPISLREQRGRYQRHPSWGNTAESGIPDKKTQ